MSAEIWAALRRQAAVLAASEPALAEALALPEIPAAGLAGLLRRMVPPVWLRPEAVEELALATLTKDDVEAALADLEAITTRNFEPGGLIGTWLGGRGFHMLLGHRLAHRLWVQDRQALAMGWKTAASALGTDIHPAAHLGRRLFLDHGIGLVIGETAVVEDDVSLWHGVTLGSTLMQSGDRHPKIRRGAVLGAGATILGNIEVGEAAVVAAGAVVLRPVPPRTTVAGNPAAPTGRWRNPYGFGEDAT